MPAPGGPFITVSTKRVFDNVPLSFDWHDYLINVRVPGGEIVVDFVIRPPRALATGFQLRCTTAGITSPAVTINWPDGPGAVIEDGSAVWTSEVADASSFRTTISTHAYVVPSDLVFTDQGIVDYMGTILVSGGDSGITYDVLGQIVCANGEEKEAVAVLPVQN